MNYKEYLDYVSKEIRRRSLSDLEVQIIELLENTRLTYAEIGEKLTYSPSYISDVAWELFGLLGQKHNVKVTRSNLFSVLSQHCYSDIEPDFYSCHNLKKTVLNPSVLVFKKDQIQSNLSLFWKLDVINKSLILKSRNPIVIDLESLTQEKVGETLINLSRQRQLPGDAVLELLKILDIYFN